MTGKSSMEAPALALPVTVDNLAHERGCGSSPVAQLRQMQFIRGLRWTSVKSDHSLLSSLGCSPGCFPWENAPRMGEKRMSLGEKYLVPSAHLPGPNLSRRSL
jgi:hypothetical protein